MKTFKLNELKKKISKDNWGVVADYLNGTCDGDILPNLLSWEEIDAVMEYLSDDGNVFCEPSYMQQVIESAIYNAQECDKQTLRCIQYMLKNPRNLTAIYEADALLEAAEQKISMDSKLQLVQKFLNSDVFLDTDEELNEIMHKHIKEFKEKDDLKDYVKNLIMDYREHPILNFSVDDVCRALSEEYFSNIMEEIYFHYEDLRETPNRYDIAGKGEYNIHGSNKPKTITLKFHGQSDDTFGEYGETYQDYDNCASGKPIQCIIDCEEHGRLLVVGQYSPDLSSGCWVISIGKVEDADVFPEWKIKLGECQHVPYSMELEIEIPNCDFNLKWYDNGKLVM